MDTSSLYIYCAHARAIPLKLQTCPPMSTFIGIKQLRIKSQMLSEAVHVFGGKRMTQATTTGRGVQILGGLDPETVRAPILTRRQFSEFFCKWAPASLIPQNRLGARCGSIARQRAPLSTD